jgi:hypothetical protein
MNTITVPLPGWDPLLPSLTHFISPLSERINPLYYLLGDPSFGDRGANVHPLSPLVSGQLFTPCFLTLPNPSQRHPWFMLHVYRDDITTSVTLSDTVGISSLADSLASFCPIQFTNNVKSQMTYAHMWTSAGWIMAGERPAVCTHTPASWSDTIIYSSC